ncbi:hypothetical protein INT47_002107 [Mucor saturninus]|uniref:Sugar phosphate transporter domain-containing protein n=1 Tax=Mucor saturninus TaxID=64648 RepID=A0A8H7R0V7_9FUNG|nr:hypothetical protein INT47_002107 [Mucor saturninus]
MPISDGRASEDSEAFSLREEDPLSLASEALLDDNNTTVEPKSLVKTSAINLFWILMWYTFATILSVYNKWMFSAEHYGFGYPLFVTSVHMIVQFTFSGTSLLIVPSLRPTKRPSVSDYIYKVLPCALATSLDIGLSNLSLKTITLSFYTMCKSSTLAFVLLFAFLFKLEKPSWKLILIIVIITAGVVLMVSDETDFNLIGFVQVMAASAFGGLRWSLTEVLLLEGYITIFTSSFFVDFLTGAHTIGIVLAGGSLAFFMIMSEFFLIKRTSVVTLSVCGIFKEVATIFISSLVFGDILTLINIIGLCITLFGIGLYNWFKLKMVTSRKQISDEVEPENTSSHHLYSTVAESTPILLVDGGLSGYRDSEDDEDNRHNRYEMR